MDGPLAHTTSIWNEDDESDQQDGWTALTASWRIQKSSFNAFFLLKVAFAEKVGTD